MQSSTAINAIQAHVLGGIDGEPLRRAVMRVILRACIAPGIATTSLRYVLLSAQLDPSLFIDAHACNLLLPCMDHLSSMGRTMFNLTESLRFESDILTDSDTFKTVRAALQAYEFKSVVYAPMLDGKSSKLDVWLEDAPKDDSTLRTWTTDPHQGGSAARKNRHGCQHLDQRIDADVALCNGRIRVIEAARAGPTHLRRCLVRKNEQGGAGSGKETLPSVRVPAVLSSSTNMCRARRPSPTDDAPLGGKGSCDARSQCLTDCATALSKVTRRSPNSNRTAWWSLPSPMAK